MKLQRLPLLLLLLLSPATHADSPPPLYTCDNGSRLEISFSTAEDGRPQATLHFADQEVTLPQVPAASGVLYRNEVIRLHSRGDEVLFEDGKGNRRHCISGTAAPLAARPPAATGSFIDIAGSVAYGAGNDRAGNDLPRDAVLIVRIRNDARALTLAEQRIELADQPVPIPFRSTIDRDLVGKQARVTVTARIEAGGKPLFVSHRAYPALRKGQAIPVEIQMKPVGRGRAR